MEPPGTAPTLESATSTAEEHYGQYDIQGKSLVARVYPLIDRTVSHRHPHQAGVGLQSEEPRPGAARSMVARSVLGWSLPRRKKAECGAHEQRRRDALLSRLAIKL